VARVDDAVVYSARVLIALAYGRCLRLQRCVTVISSDASCLSELGTDVANVQITTMRSPAGREVRESELGCTDRSHVTRTGRSDVRHWSITRNGRWVLQEIADLLIDDKQQTPSLVNWPERSAVLFRRLRGYFQARLLLWCESGPCAIEYSDITKMHSIVRWLRASFDEVVTQFHRGGVTGVLGLRGNCQGHVKVKHRHAILLHNKTIPVVLILILLGIVFVQLWQAF